MRRFAIAVALILATPLVLATILALVLANPEGFRDQITTSIKASTGYDVTIDGELNWRYWPPIALSVQALVVRVPGDSAPLASLETLSISVDLLPLLMGNETVNVRRLSLAGLTLRPAIDKAGVGNWEQAEEPFSNQSPSDGSSSDASSSDGSSSGKQTAPRQASPKKTQPARQLALSINGIDITNVTVDYQDESSGAQYLLEIASLSTGPVQLAEPVTLALQARLHDVPADIVSSLSIQGNVIVRENMDQLDFSNLHLTNLIQIPDLVPIAIDLTFTGNLDISENKLQMQLRGMVDESTIAGSLGLTSTDTTSLTFDMVVDRINVDRYQESDHPNRQATTPSASSTLTDKPLTPTSPPLDSELIPMEPFRDFDIQGKLTVDDIEYESYAFSDLQLDVSNRNGLFRGHVSLHGYGGDAHIEMNTSIEDGVKSTLSLSLNQMDISKLTDFKWITGQIDIQSTVAFEGTMLSDAMKTLDGTSQFSVNHGTLDITPLKQLTATIDSLRGKPSSVSDWPDYMPFETLTGRHVMQHGTRENQRFNFTLENIQVNGEGGFDYFVNYLQYDIFVNLAESENDQYRVSPALAHIQWPLHCEGRMDASPVDLCLPNSKAIQTLVTDIARQELKRKGRKKIDKIIDEKAPEKLKDLLKGIFKR